MADMRKTLRAVHMTIFGKLSRAVNLKFRNMIKCTHACALYVKYSFLFFYVLCTVRRNIFMQYKPIK